MSRTSERRPMRIAFRPGRMWRFVRLLTQSLALVAIVLAPFLGGWQRLERNDLSSWNNPDTELPARLRERLPRGDTAGRAYDSNVLIGGGTAAELGPVPFADPLAAGFVLLADAPTGRALLAFAIPFLIALIAGRVFCGWFCPFGTLSRIVAALLTFVPFARRLEIPPSRPVRYVVLAIGIVAGLFGVQAVLYLALPHALLQQSVYSMWLLGGGGAALGLVVGLVIAGVFLGPTTYCATVCPTGGALGLVGHARLVRLGISEPKKCGSACRLCSQACWIQLEPSSGDAGPDCDLCARCVPACPRTNLQITIGLAKPASKKHKALPVLVALLALGSSTRVDAQRESPELVLAAERMVDGVVVAVDVVDKTGIPVAADSDETLSGSDVSVFIGRGDGDFSRGPLDVAIFRGQRRIDLGFDAPTSPISTQGRSIYRRRIDTRLRPGDVVEIRAIDGWLREPQRFVVPHPGVDASVLNVLIFIVGGIAMFGGLISLGLAIRPRT